MDGDDSKPSDNSKSKDDSKSKKTVIRISARPDSKYTGRENAKWRGFFARHLPWLRKKFDQMERAAEAKVRQEEEKVRDIRAGSLEKEANALSTVLGAVNKVNKYPDDPNRPSAPVSEEQLQSLLENFGELLEDLADKREFHVKLIDEQDSED